MDSNLKDITIFLNLEIDNEQKIEYINELSMIFEEPKKKINTRINKRKINWE